MKELRKGVGREIITSFQGMFGDIDPSKLTESQLALLENFTLKSYGNIGRLVSRNGFTRYNANQIDSGGSGCTAIAEVTLNGTDYILANNSNTSSSVLRRNTSPYTGAWANIGTDAMFASRFQCVVLRNRAYLVNMTNGTTPNYTYDGTNLLEHGCLPCDTQDATFTPSNSTGTLTSSTTYNYFITFLYDGSQESGVVDFKTVTMGLTDDTVAITNIPVGNNRVTARKIYRSKAGSNSLASADVYYLYTISDNVTTSYTDITPDTDLNQAIEANLLFELGRPHKAKYAAVHKDRLFLGNLIDGLLDAESTNDFTLTASNGAGALTTNTTYNYRFKKFWYTGETASGASNGDGVLYCSAYTSKSVVMGATDDTVDIDYIGTDPFIKYIAVERASAGAGSTDYQLVSLLGWFWDSATVFVDITADASRLGIPLPVSIPGYTSYSSLITVSDAGKPDKFSLIETAQDGTLIPSSNEWDIGEPITGIHSEENRIIIFSDKNIYELDTSSISRNFWKINKLVSGIGSDAGLQCQVGEGYVFIHSGKRTDQDETVETVYYWSGRGKPQSINDSIITYFWAGGISEFLDIKYDNANNLVQIIATNTGGTVTYIFIYNLDTAQWEIITNATNLNFKVLCPTKNYGMIIGGGDGYIHRQTENAFQDTIAGSARTFTTKLRTKTWELYDTDLRPRMFRADITSSGSGTPGLITAVDGTANTIENTPALASGFNRILVNSFTGATARSFRQVYFELQCTANIQYKVHGLMIDFNLEHEASGGR